MTEVEQKKWLAETDKLLEEARLLSKKSMWFEFSLMLAVIGVTIAVTKFLL